MRVIWWLRRDIRLDDNTALGEAFRQSDGAVIPCFVLDPRILQARGTGAPRVHYLMEALRDLDQQLQGKGARLIMREGEPIAELTNLCRETGADGVFFNRDYEPYAVQRDQRVLDELRQAGFRAQVFGDRLMFEPEDIRTANNKPFTVYTPFRRRWLAKLDEDRSLLNKRSDANKIKFQPIADTVESRSIPTAEEIGFHVTQQMMAASEAAAQQVMHEFVARGHHGLREYHHNRNNLSIEGTSRMAMHLRHGTLSPRAPIRAALAIRDQTDDADVRKACETWVGEIAWRDFYTHIGYHFPLVFERPYRELFEHFPFRDSQEDVQIWQAGRTGYPLIDAAMRQMNTEAFMHNRGRLNTASFFVKHLLLDYRAGGERYFMQQLACGDYAVNNGNWQWVAGSSNDPQPYFRVFNPVTQGETYDPEGAYVRRYVPELAHVPTEYIHAPWTMPKSVATKAGVEIGRDYPQPMVEHGAARQRALAAFKEARARSEEQDDGMAAATAAEDE
jgi:deoxyribodipyrimidine photo-lyase